MNQQPSAASAETGFPLGIVLKGYPRLSETFIAQEILNLEHAGFDVTLFSLRFPTDRKTHPVHQQIAANVVYLPEYLYQEPLRVIRSWWFSRKQPGYKNARNCFLKDLWRDPTPNRVRRFGQAMVLAAELPGKIQYLYAHFLHTPASVTRYCAVIRDLPWACSAHAKDIYTSPRWEIHEKLAECQWLTTCTHTNVEYLRKLDPDPQKVSLNYHGLDLDRFDTEPPTVLQQDGANSDHPVILLSVGRAVEKKGYDGLINALSMLDRSLNWKLIHIGGGKLLDTLQSSAHELGIGHAIQWLGAQSQQTVLEHYRSSDIFVLNCRIDDTGDRDGLPNVMLEAQSQGLPVVSTSISGIPELIDHQINGLLVPSDSPERLSEALDRLIRSPQLRAEMGKNGQQKVRKEFEMHAAFDKLVLRFNEPNNSKI